MIMNNKEIQEWNDWFNNLIISHERLTDRLDKHPKICNKCMEYFPNECKEI
jgi:hypothetical protein